MVCIEKLNREVEMTEERGNCRKGVRREHEEGGKREEKHRDRQMRNKERMMKWKWEGKKEESKGIIN